MRYYFGMGYLLLEGGAEFGGGMREPDLKAIELACYVLDVGETFGVQKLTRYVLRSDANTRRLVDPDGSNFRRPRRR